MRLLAIWSGDRLFNGNALSQRRYLLMSLPEMLRSADNRDYHSALKQLSSIPTDEAIGLLEQLALESDEKIRRRAVSAMAKVSPERAEALALRNLSDPNLELRVNALYNLRELGSRTAAPQIAHLLATDPDELVRGYAALALGSLGDSSVIPILTTAAEQDPGADYEVRCRAVSAMAKVSPERAEALALRNLSDPNLELRVNALYNLRELGSRTAAPQIAHLLATDPDEIIRWWAALALGSLGDSSVIPILTTAAEQDPGADYEGRTIREAAIRSIEMIRSRLADQDNPATH
jgi:HEAT repeat protein